MAGMDDFFSLLRGGGQPGIAYPGGTPNFREMGQTIPLSAGGYSGSGQGNAGPMPQTGQGIQWNPAMSQGGNVLGGMGAQPGGGLQQVGGGTMHPQVMQMIMSLIAHPGFRAMMTKAGGAAPATTAPTTAPTGGAPTAVGPGQPGQTPQLPSLFKPMQQEFQAKPNWAGNFQPGWGPGPPPPGAVGTTPGRGGGGAPTAVGGGFPNTPTPTGTQPPPYAQPTDSSYQGGYG